MVAGGKVSSGSIAGVAGYLLLLLASEASERQTMVAGGVVRPLTVEASHGSIAGVDGRLLLLLACEASKRQTVVVGGVVHPLTAEASGEMASLR